MSPFGATALLLLATLLHATEKSDEATLYRDEFGIPHVYAATLEAAAFAVGYAQAEDRLEELLKNYRRANGTMSEVFGLSNFRNDMIARNQFQQGGRGTRRAQRPEFDADRYHD